MIKIKPVLVNVVVMYSLMLGGMALSCFDAIERGVHLSAVYNFLVWILGGTLCVICICHTYKIDEKGVRQLWLFIPKFTPWSAFTEVSIEPLFPDQPSDTRDRCDMPQSRRQQNQPVLVSRNAPDALSCV